MEGGLVGWEMCRRDGFREALNVNLHFSEVSDLSSRGHFVDLGQENTSV